MKHIYGQPGRSLLSARGMSADRIARGVEGEQKVAAVLDQWAQRNGAYVFHSVAIPGKSFDYDHVVVKGGRVLVVDSKNWAGGHTYHFRPVWEEGNHPWAKVTRDGEDFAGGDVHLGWSLITLSHQLGVNVDGVVCLVGSRVGISVDEGVPHAATSLSDLAGHLDQYFRRATGAGNVEVLSRLARRAGDSYVHPRPRLAVGVAALVVMGVCVLAGLVTGNYYLAGFGVAAYGFYRVLVTDRRFSFPLALVSLALIAMTAITALSG